ncbi:MAG: (d)CMP kinase [Endomicrobia bacterium]|nr:(d)CMP kinase [Endomicrobiia bacterium]MDW8056043.1 (d)CMP kinase [Elusimicrobiota bacterium]
MKQNENKIVVAIDGPAGAGKTTVSKLVAKKLGFVHVDTGAMYRAVTYKLLNSDISLDDIEAIKKTLETLDIDFKLEDDELKVLVDKKDVSKEIRSEYVSANVNFVAAIPEVRQKLRELQRLIGMKYNCVMEGRDITTAVFPETKFKFYLDAPVEERALRRYNELVEKGDKVTFEEVKSAIIRRDELDRTRGINPLRIDENAIVINTFGLTQQQVADKIVEYVKSMSNI